MPGEEGDKAEAVTGSASSRQPSQESGRQTPEGAGARRARRLLKAAREGSKLTEALKALGKLADNDKDARQVLRTGTAEAVEQLDAVVKEAESRLRDSEERLQAAESAARRAEGAIEQAWGPAEGLLKAVEGLDGRAKEAKRRAEAAEEVLRKCKMDENEEKELKEGDPGSDGFLRALEHAEEARAECRRLLRVRHRRSVMELLSEIAGMRESAMGRLAQWCKAKAKEAFAEDEPPPEDEARISRALSILNERDDVRKEVLDEASRARRGTVFRRFVAALTRGGRGGKPRPMEVRMGEPAKFAGDMLAWMHQTEQSERDLASRLISDDDSRSSFVATSMGAVARPFKARIDQAIASGPRAPALLQLRGVIDFYASRLQCGEELSASIREASDAAKRGSEGAARAKGEAAAKQAKDNPQAASEGTAKTASDLIRAYQTATTPCSGEAAKDAVEAAVHPLLENLRSGQIREEAKADSLATLTSALSEDDCTSGRADGLRAEAKAAADDAADSHAAEIVAECGLAVPWVEDGGGRQSEEALGRLVNRVRSSEPGAPQLKDSDLRACARARVKQRLAEAYESAASALDGGGAESPSTSEFRLLVGAEDPNVGRE